MKYVYPLGAFIVSPTPLPREALILIRARMADALAAVVMVPGGPVGVRLVSSAESFTPAEEA